MKSTYKEYLSQLDFMLSWTEKLKNEIAELPYQDDDIRGDYFKTNYTNTYHYYIDYILFFKSELLKDNLVSFQEDFESFNVHLHRLSEITISEYLKQGHFNIINQRVFIMAWSLFELAISTFYTVIVDDNELQKQYQETFNDVLKCVDIKEGKEEKLKKLLIKKSIYHIPIVRKYNYLFKSKKYSRNVEEDKEFLKFFGTLRNTVHSNFIYYGNDFKFRFLDSEFLFENGKEVRWSDPYETGIVPSVILYFKLIGNLNSIVMELFNSNPHDDLIPYPDLNAL